MTVELVNESASVAVPDVDLTICDNTGADQQMVEGKADSMRLTFAAREDKILQRAAEAALENVLPLIVALEATYDGAIAQVNVEDFLYELKSISNGSTSRKLDEILLTFGAWLTMAKRESSEMETEVSSCGCTLSLSECKER